MTITTTDFEEMHITFTRSIRTANSETFLLISDDPDAGATFSKGRSRMGRIIIQYTTEPLKKRFVNGTLLLEREWEDDAVEELVQIIDNRVVDSIGGGTRLGRETFDVSVLKTDHVASFTDRVTDDRDRGLIGVHKQIDETKQLVRELPDNISGVVDEIIDEQYNDIENIIESQESEKKKKEALRNSMKVGLERGLPTILYEMAGEKEK